MTEAIKQAFNMKYTDEDFINWVSQNRLDLKTYLMQPGNPLKPVLQMTVVNTEGLRFKSVELESDKQLTKTFIFTVGFQAAAKMAKDEFPGLFSVSYVIHKSYYIAFQTIDGRVAKVTIKLQNVDKGNINLDLQGKKPDQLTQAFFDGVEEYGRRHESNPQAD